jgi:hypothetical protein
MEKSVIARMLLITSFMLSSVIALAASFEVPVKGTEKMLVNLPQGVLQITANPSLKSVKVQMSSQAAQEYGLYSENNVIELRKKEGISRDSFLLGKAEPGKYSIEIQSPSLPLEVHVFDGQVHLLKWSKDALIHLQKGKLTCREGNGTLALHGQSGEINIFDHQGRIDLDVYKAQLNIKNLNGDADIENFAGENNIDKAKGFISLTQDQGSTKMTGSAGTFKFELGKASLNSQNFSGRVEGQTQEGPVNILMSADGEVNVKSQSARVTVQTPKASGAWLSLSTTDGDISGPSYIKVNREAGQKNLRGRLNGDVQKGSIIVRSQEGAIIIR